MATKTAPKVNTHKTCLARDCDQPRDETWFLCQRHIDLLPKDLLQDLTSRLPNVKLRQSIASDVFDHYWDKGSVGVS